VQAKGTAKTRRKQVRIRPRGRRPDHQPFLFPSSHRPVFRNRRVRMEVDRRGETTPYGGLAAAHLLAKKVGLDRAIDERLHLLRFHLPYYESDHCLTHAYNLFVGGTCIEDIVNLQESTAVRNLLGAERIPDPTTAGDFLRRFEWGDLDGLQDAIDTARVEVWSQMPRRVRRTATIDIDSHIKEVYGQCKQGADFSYTKKWSYHPLIVTLAETSECLRLINRPGNAASDQGAVPVLKGVLPLVSDHFDRVYLRGDSKFCRRAIVKLCTQADRPVGFALVKEGSPNVRQMAELLPEKVWKPYVARPDKQRPPRSGKRRRKRVRHRRAVAAARGYRNLQTVREWVAEAPYSMTRCEGVFRLIIKRQEIEERTGQGRLFRMYIYRYVLSNIPPWEKNTAAVVRFAYGRCDQENAIEQAKNGLHGFRMPTGTLLANGAFLLMAELAWCLRAWLSLLALPAETGRWEWKRFRQAFVYVAAKIVRGAREVMVRISASHRWAEALVKAMARLRRLPFR